MAIDFHGTGFPLTIPGPALLHTRESLSVLLYQPEIPQNTGNIARTCAATRTPLYLVEPLGFRITDKLLKRAGLDYWPYVRMKLYADFDTARIDIGHSRLVYFSARAAVPYYDFNFRPGDCLVFGPETRGLPEELLASYPGDVINVPIDRARVRSLNLATTVGIALFEALRQLRQQKLNFVPAQLPAPGRPASEISESPHGGQEL